MKKKLITLLCATLLVAWTQAFGASAPALGTGQFYVSVRGGAVWIDSTFVSVTNLATGTTVSGDVNMDTGYAVTGAVGYVMSIAEFDDPFRPLKLRLEIESGYANATKYASGTVSGYSVSGKLEAEVVPVMFNVLLEYSLSESFYVFGGVGGGLSIQKVSLSANAGSASDSTSKTNNYYAAQARLGVGYMINENVSLELSYRLYSQQFSSPLTQAVEGGIAVRF